MEQKHAFVRQWLEGIFGKDEVPDYEINSQTVGFLHQLAKRNESKEKALKCVLEDVQQKTSEYQAETRRLEDVCQWVGFSAGDLSPAALGYMKSLAAIAVAMDLKDCSDTSFCLALTELCRQRESDSVRRVEVGRQVERLQDEVKRALHIQATQKRSLSELAEEMGKQGPVVARHKKESGFLQQKAVQYQRLATSLKKELERIGYDHSLSHASLQQSAKEIEELQKQLAPLKAQLGSYQDLPPDLNLAKVKLEEAKQELARLEAELASNIDLVHAEK